MNCFYYHNMAGQRFELPERPLEPPDCWRCEDGYDEEDDVMDEPELSFDHDTHTYYLDGRAIPSVTQLTDIYSVLPVQEGDCLELTMEAAAERGTILHAYLEHRLWGGERDSFELPNDLDGHADGVDLFLAEHTLDPYLTETPMWGEADGVRFAGTPDYVGLFDGVLSVLDWKFVSQVQKTKVGAQLSGYLSLCMSGDWFPEKLWCVQFLPDGAYRLYPAGTLADSFYLCLSVWKEKHKKHPRGGIA